MALRRTPGTRVSTQQLAAPRATPIDFSPLANAVQGFVQDLRQEKQKAEEFDLSTQFVREMTELQQDFRRRQEEAPLGADGFTEQVFADYGARHEAQLEALRGQGFSDESIRSYAGRLNSLRGSVLGQAMAFQVDSTKELGKQKAETQDLQLSQYVADSPLALDSALGEMETAARAQPGLTAQEVEEFIDRRRSGLIDASRKAWALRNPAEVIALLDPKGDTDTTKSLSGGAYGILGGFNFQAYQQQLAPVEGTGSPGTSSALGHYQFLAPTWLSYYKQTFPGTGESDQQILAHRQQRSVANKVLEKFTSDNIATLTAAGAPVNNLTVYLAHFLGPQDALKVLNADGNTKLSSVVSAASVKANRNVLGKGQTVIDLLRRFAPKFDTQVTTPPPGPEAEGEIVVTARTPQDYSDHPILKHLDGEQMLQTLAWAREADSKAKTEIRAATQVALSNANAAHSQGEDYAGPPLTRDAVVGAFGEIEGAQRWAEYESGLAAKNVMQGLATRRPEEMTASLETLRPNPGSETYATDLANYNAAAQGAQKLLAARKDDPAAYAIKYFDNIPKAFARSQQEGFVALQAAYDRMGVPQGERSAMPKEMLGKVMRQYGTLSAQEQLASLQSWTRDMGPLYNNFVQSVSKTWIDDDALVYKLLQQTPGGDNTMLQILQGKKVLAQDPARKPKTQEMRGRFQDLMLNTIGTLNPQISNSYQSAAQALYVANNGNPTTLDEDLYMRSLRTVLGGSPNNDNTGWADFRNRTWGFDAVKELTILPPGVNKDEFENWVDGLQPGQLTRMSLEKSPPMYGDLKTPVLLEDIIDEGVFVMASPGVYMVKMSTDGKPLVTKSGRQFLVRIPTGAVR